MLHAALLAVALTSTTSSSPISAKTPVQQCFGSMDGAVYHGDPADRALMKANVAACARGVAHIQGIRTQPAQGPEKLFLLGRILDRAATLSYMGLGDAGTALPEVIRANLYFRIAAGLRNQTSDYHAAALANATLTRIQLGTLHADLAAARTARASIVALRTHRTKRAPYVAPARVTTTADTDYHKL
jgi:hypothetical protein